MIRGTMMNMLQSFETDHSKRMDRSFLGRSRAMRVGVLLALMSSGNLAWAVNQLRDISYSSLPDRGIEIVFQAEQPISMPSSFATQHPARVAVDFPGMRSALEQRTREVGLGLVRSITAVEAGDRTRVVVNLVDNMPFELSVDGDRAVMHLGSQSSITKTPAPVPPPPNQLMTPMEQAPAEHSIASGGGMPAVSEPADSTEPARMMPAMASDEKRLASVDFRRGREESGRAVFMLTDPNTVVDMYEDGGQVNLDFRGTKVPENLLRKFDVADFGTPVKLFEVTKKGENTHVRFRTDANFEYLAYQTDNEFTVEFRPLTKEEKEALKKEKVGYTGERLSLNFQDIDVRAVLQLLGDFTGKNMVVSDTVTGNITLRLKNVPWDQAMDLILKTRGLDKRVDDNIILIAPAAELAAQEEQKLESQLKIEELAPLRAEFFQINYAKAAEIAALLKNEENQLLTPDRGNVTFDPRTNMLLIRDTAAKLEDMQRLIARLDVPVQQVMVESRIVVASDSFSRDIGVRLGFSRANRIAGTDVLIGGAQQGGVSGTGSFDTGLWGKSQDGLRYPAMVEGLEGGTQGLMVNLPSGVSGGVGSALNVLVGKVGSYLLQLELSAMQTEGKGEVISNPRLITADKEKALVKQGLEIPYQGVDENGNPKVEFKAADLVMEVTPSITPDDRVILEINVKNDQPDFGRATAAGVPINTREVETNVLVDNGDTVVLGGVYEISKSEAYEMVPVLGELPVVGNLFKHRTRSVSNNELLIFVTPKILKEDLTMN